MPEGHSATQLVGTRSTAIVLSLFGREVGCWVCARVRVCVRGVGGEARTQETGALPSGPHPSTGDTGELFLLQDCGIPFIEHLLRARK